MEQPSGTVQRMNWGCGSVRPVGWINADRLHGDNIAVTADIVHGLPIADDTLDYIVSIHALQDLPFMDVVPALTELKRVLRSGGVLRLGLPDLDRAIVAYLSGDKDYFYIPDRESQTIGGKLAAQMTWYGSSRMLFTWDSISEWLEKAGFTSVLRCHFGTTASRYPEIVELDDRERESLFVEAVK